MEITENKLKDILTEQRGEYERFVENVVEKERKEYQRFIDIVKEDFDSRVQLIAEQYHDIKTSLNSHTGTLASHTEMIGSIMEDMQIIKSDVQFLKGSLKKKVDYEEFESLAKRVSLLESKIRK